ncbi:hypothetical protein GCM10009584_04340 [Ornithinimicrobium humiphilum]|uniref:DNA-binding transcriptional MerR regulator n=1 Tax=Ornithinimicrobium humiphilum TaxID=125288 RepID=A0A543K7V2_9MICO|nr:MerR family transcriptional regulator [Ornithinimicrobium humiphilum]TQM91162.1 DNA-binding transcriptional MerR regulator [Ornithinimicrobium humiphilum]
MADRVHDADRGVYGISVAAELVGLAAPSLRLYEAHGLLEPDRTPGGTRRYSTNDLERLREIAGLLDAGVNIAGVARILALQDENRRLAGQVESLRGQVEGLRRRARAGQR